jgi:hypothetical protein
LKGKKTTLDRQSDIELEIVKIIEMVGNLQTQQQSLDPSILEKREALKQFQGHPNLLFFYRIITIRIEEMFISFKAVAGGFVNPTEGRLSTINAILEFFGDHMKIIPVLGDALDTILKWTISKALDKADSDAQSNKGIVCFDTLIIF